MANNVITGSLAADNAVVRTDTGIDTAYQCTVQGTFVGTVTFQILRDGTEGWVNAPLIYTAAGASGSATLTAPGTRFVGTAGCLAVQAVMHPYTSGTAEVTLAGTPGINVSAAAGGGGGAATIADGADVAQGTTTDAPITTTTTGAAATGIGLWKGFVNLLILLRAQLPAALVGGRLDVNVGAAPAAITLGAGAAAVGTVGVTSAVTPADRTATGAVGALNANVALAANGCGTVTAAIATNASWNGTLTFQATTDGTNWLNIAALNVSTGAFGATYTTTNTNALFQMSAAGYAQVRVIATIYSAGSATVTLEGSAGSSCFPGLLDSAGRLIAVGAAAAGSTVAGNPVLTGGWDGTNVQNLTVAKNNTSVTPANLAGIPAMGINASNVAQFMLVTLQSTDANTVTAGYGLNINSLGMMYGGGTTMERVRNNVDATLLASAARTTTQGPTTLTTYNLGAIIFVLDMTTVGTGSVTLTINEVDPASGKSILLLSGAAVTTNSTNVYTIDPLLTAAANSIAKNRLTRTLSWTVTANNSNSAQYSLGTMQQVS